MASEQLVVFQLGKEEYAVSIYQVKEIIRFGGATKLPNTPEFLEGIINLRGKVVPVVNLAKRFGLMQGMTEGRQAVIVEAAGGEIGVVVDEVREVIRLEDSAVEQVQAMDHCEFLRGIGKLEGRLLIILDLDRLFSHSETELLRNAG